jgi:hypothetical protein
MVIELFLNEIFFINSQVTLLTYCIYVHHKGYTLEIWELHIKRNSKYEKYFTKI